MAVKFTPLGWTRWLDQYVRMAKIAKLFTGAGLQVDALQEISGGGYAPHEILTGRWEMSNRGAIITATYPEVLWRFTEPIETPITGFYVADKDGQILWWERFAEPAFEAKRKNDSVAIDISVEIDTEG